MRPHSGGEVIAVNIFSLDYAVLLIAFLIAVYNVFKAPDRDSRREKDKY